MKLPFGTRGDVGLEPYEKFVRDHGVVGRSDCPFSVLLDVMSSEYRDMRLMRSAKLYWYV